MSLFKNITVRTATAESELSGFRQFLEANETFSETAVVKELRQRPNLSCLVGYLKLGARPNVYKFELPLMGSFKADLVVGNSHAREFTLVEFESGKKHSLFQKKGTLQYRNWSPEFEHGFGQLIDWGWIIDDCRGTKNCRNIFGCDDISVLYLLVCGGMR